MKPKRQRAILLAKDQVWKVNGTYVEIVEIGKRLIHYRMFQGKRHQANPLATTSIETAQNYLQSHRAALVKGLR